MKNQKKGVSLTLIFLVLVVLAMTIGFATYNATLNINGNVTAKAASWNVHYNTATLNKTEGSVTPVAEGTSLTNTDYTFTVTLNPGEFYEGTFQIYNEGTIPAKLTTITMSTLTEAQAKYLTYTVTYDGTEYSATTSNINTVINSLGSKDVKVKVAYVLPANASDLPATDQTVTVSGSFAYVNN